LIRSIWSEPVISTNTEFAHRFRSVGKLLSCVQVRIAGDGEIQVRGASVTQGYYREAELTKAAFTEDGWFKTGDVGRFTEDGFLQIVDRKKDILVTAGGKNVPPQNIELRFADDPYIAHLVVHGDGERFLVAGVWLNEAAVKAHLDEQGVAAGSVSGAQIILPCVLIALYAMRQVAQGGAHQRGLAVAPLREHEQLFVVLHRAQQIGDFLLPIAEGAAADHTTVFKRVFHITHTA
jgi:long-subunit acyl-CoA synthetase (AMP-forming)